MKNDGGPAFPIGVPSGYAGGACATGMSLRNYVAAKAFQQMLRWEAAEGYSYQEIAEQAYMAADAFIAQSEKGEDSD